MFTSEDNTSCTSDCPSHAGHPLNPHKQNKHTPCSRHLVCRQQHHQPQWLQLVLAHSTPLYREGEGGCGMLVEELVFWPHIHDYRRVSLCVVGWVGGWLVGVCTQMCGKPPHMRCRRAANRTTEEGGRECYVRPVECASMHVQRLPSSQNQPRA